MNSCMYVCVYALVQNRKYATFGARYKWSLCVIFKQCVVCQQFCVMPVKSLSVYISLK